MSTQSNNNRKYELKARAESQERTRQRIAKAAAELHEKVGPAETTVAEIARRAGVSRLTVYKHFPDDASLYEACSAHFRSEHPLPDFEPALAIEDAVDRVRSVLALVYGEIYRETQGMVRNLSRDRGSDPALDALMEKTRDAFLDRLAGELAGGFEAQSEDRLRAIVSVALDFWTWDRLAGEGLDDDEAASLMTDAVVAVAGAPATARQAPTSAARSRPGR
jgi:AcrR family transcriptional regulator